MARARSNLILPKSYHQEHVKHLTDSFKVGLQKRLDEQKNRKDPYFLAYHESDNRVTGEVKNSWSVTDKIPRFMARQIVYWVDNKKGFKEWLWTISDSRKPHMNTDGVSKAIKAGAIVTKK